MRVTPSRKVVRSLVFLSLLVLGMHLQPSGVIPRVGADESTEKSDADKAKDEILQQMKDRAELLEVRFVGTPPRQAELVPTPLIHYSDQIRRLPESTLWVWQLDGIPVCFCKVERMKSKTSSVVAWQYCCVPTFEDKADITWKRDFRWKAKETGFQWIPVADTAVPHQQEGIRLTELKGIARGFTGEIKGPPEAGTQQSRLLPRPLHRFSSPQTKVVDGAVFGLTSNGTNPDVLLIVEALKEPVAGSSWRYAVIGMTGDAATVKFKDQEVWSKTFTRGPGDHKSWMWYVSTQ